MNPIRNHPGNRCFYSVCAALCIAAGMSACSPEPVATISAPSPTASATPAPSENTATPLPVRSISEPGQIVDYAAQSGDTLEAVAVHFNTTIEEIRKNNPDLPEKTTTLVPGRILKVPLYLAPFLGTPFQMLPDSEVVAGPAVSDFNGRKFVDSHSGIPQGVHRIRLCGFI